MEESYPLIGLVTVAYLLAGFVKGVIGMGLPTVAIGVLAVAMTPAQAAAIIIAPAIATNVWQMVAGPDLAMLARRLGPMLAMLCVGAWEGSDILTGGNARQAALGLGLALIAYAVFGLSKIRLALPQRAEIWVGPLVGFATGIVLAATGVFVLPALPYMQAIGLEKDRLVQALGLHFTVSTLVLALVLWSGGAFGLSLATLSLFAIVPAVIGMLIGQRMRGRMEVATFRVWLFVGLLLLGLHLTWRNLL